MTPETKHLSRYFLSGALVVFILLAASLSSLQLHSGTPFPGGISSEDASLANKSAPILDTYSFPFLQGFLALVFIGLLVYVAARLIVLINLKEILPWILGLAILLTIMLLLPRTSISQSVPDPGEFTEIITPPAVIIAVTPLGQPPKVIIGLVIAVLAFGLSWSVAKFLNKNLKSAGENDPFLQEAKDAVQALRSGQDFTNVILRCYLQMTAAIQQEQGVERKTTLTVSEFRSQLETMGFPDQPVRHLTTLFEKVRYGLEPVNDRDETVALQCLTEIIQFCRGDDLV